MGLGGGAAAGPGVSSTVGHSSPAPSPPPRPACAHPGPQPGASLACTRHGLAALLSRDHTLLHRTAAWGAGRGAGGGGGRRTGHVRVPQPQRALPPVLPTDAHRIRHRTARSLPPPPPPPIFAPPRPLTGPASPRAARWAPAAPPAKKSVKQEGPQRPGFDPHLGRRAGAKWGHAHSLGTGPASRTVPVGQEGRRKLRAGDKACVTSALSLLNATHGRAA